MAQHRTRRVGDVPDLVATGGSGHVAAVSEQIEVALHRVRECIATAHESVRGIATGRISRNVGQKHRVHGVGDIVDRNPALLHLAYVRIGGSASAAADISDLAAVLILDPFLIAL